MTKEKLNIIVIRSEFNEDIVSNLFLGVKKFFDQKKIQNKITEIRVPGAFELPFIAKQVIEKSNLNIDCIITLGCVIKGETAHFEYISSACVSTLSKLTLQTNTPIMLGVITAYTKEQAIARSQIDFDEAGNLNIGYNAANAAFQTLISKKNHNL
tara:strand:- start:2065 stop:2529 length:465 start_codon:yes stop_codon:yes gene_type:complete